MPIRAHAAADQPGAQLLAGPGQPRLDRPHRAAQPPRRLLVAQPLQVAQQHRQPEPIGEPAQLLVQLGPGLRPLRFVGLDPPDRHGRLRDARSRARRRAASRRARPATRAAVPVQPARHRIPPADRARPPGQHQERRLRGVLGVVAIPEDPPADPHHHRPVALHQRRERRLGLLGRPEPEPLQQRAVGQPRQRADPEQRGDLLQQRRGFDRQGPNLPILGPTSSHSVRSVPRIAPTFRRRSRPDPGDSTIREGWRRNDRKLTTSPALGFKRGWASPTAKAADGPKGGHGSIACGRRTQTHRRIGSRLANSSVSERTDAGPSGIRNPESIIPQPPTRTGVRVARRSGRLVRSSPGSISGPRRRERREIAARCTKARSTVPDRWDLRAARDW